LVTDLHCDAQEGHSILLGYDFVHFAGRRGVRLPPSLIAVSAEGKFLIDDTTLRYIHKLNKGWMWETFAREHYPIAPFLLTDVQEYQLIYQGAVSVDSANKLGLIVRGWPSQNGIYYTAARAADWLGELKIDIRESPYYVTLIAFSASLQELPQRCSNIELPDWEERLDSLLLGSSRSISESSKDV
jgi:hypothetical protein